MCEYNEEMDGLKKIKRERSKRTKKRDEVN